MNEELKRAMIVVVVGTAIVAVLHVSSLLKKLEQAPAEITAPAGTPLSHKCAMHSKVAEVPTKYVDGVGCYEKRFHRWELVQFPED